VILQTYTELIKNLTIADRKNIKQNQNESPNIYIKIKMILNIQISKDTWKT
jgi:predicted N-acyltransferase